MSAIAIIAAGIIIVLARYLVLTTEHGGTSTLFPAILVFFDILHVHMLSLFFIPQVIIICGYHIFTSSDSMIMTSLTMVPYTILRHRVDHLE